MIKDLKLTKRRKLLGAVIICVILITGSTILWQMGQVAEAAILDPHPGLVGWWRFDEEAGTVAEDSSGYGNDGTIYGATWVDGKHGKALSFDGTNDYVKVSDSPSLDLTSEATIAFWFMPEELGRLQHLIAKAGAYDIYLREDNRIYVRKIALSPVEFTYCNALTIDDLNKWMLVVGIYDHTSENKIKVYINGVFAAETDLTTDIATSISDFAIGAWSSGTADFTKGVVDEVRIYNRALSLSEIETLFQKGPDFSSRLLARVPEGTTQFIATLSWQGNGNVSITVETPSKTYTEDMMSVYQRTTYSSNGMSDMLNIKRVAASLNELASDENWYVLLEFDDVEDYRMTVEVQR